MPAGPNRPRVLLFTGKGGVGKTTVAAATARVAAERGGRTLVLSTDRAHSLADAFDRPLGPEPTPVEGSLWGLQLDPQDRLEGAWSELRDWLTEVLGWAGLEALEAEELSTVPGLDEVLALAALRDLVADGDWATVVVDCAPTAETIRLLSLPDVLARYARRLLPAGQALASVVGPVAARVSGLPVPGQAVFGAAMRLHARLDGVRALLADARRTSVRLVVTPERMVVAEARRTYTYLSLFGYPVDAVVVNRLLPGAVGDPWFDRWRATQSAQLDEIDEAFAPLPVLRVELAPDEVVGLPALSRFGAGLYRDHDPLAVLHPATELRLERRGDTRVLSVPLPLARADDLDVVRREGELLVRVGSWRRALVLPDSLRDRPAAGARMVGDRLEVSFGPVDEDGRVPTPDAAGAPSAGGAR